MSSHRRGTPWSAREAGDALFVLAMLGVAAAAAWPIYRSTSYLALVGAAVAAGATIAVLRRRWPSGALVAGAAALAYLGIGLTLVMPVWSDGVLASARGVLFGVVTAWKDLLTVDLPVGGYRNLLAPALVVFLAGALGGLTLAWRPGRGAGFAVPLLLATQVFGLLFGADAPGTPWRVAGVDLASQREALLGLGGFLVALCWLAWRARAARVGALRRAARAGGLPAPRLKAGPAALRAASCGGVLMVAVVVGVVVAPVVDDQPRQVLRTGDGPDLAVRAAVSPLTLYRRFFDADTYEKPLFSVRADGPMPDRVRLAVLTSYDGREFTVGSPSQPTLLRRVPSRLTPLPGTPTQVTVTGGHLGAVTPLWLPIAGSPESVTFQGARARALTDGFYFDRAAGGAVDTAPGGLREGDRYRIDATAPARAEVSTLTAPGGSPRWKPPQSLLDWLDANPVPAGGPGLVKAVETLRARGYLSHDVDVDAATMPWVSALAPQGYAYVPSAAGHSLGRIDQMFRALNERQMAVDGAGAPEETLVGAVGDDEQFATAAALLADQLGFPARVVLGARLTADAHDPADPGFPVCADGVCTGASMAAWVEVQGADGRWAALDVTPQYTKPIVDRPQDTRLPENATEVLPKTAQEVAPPDPSRSGGSRRAAHQPHGDAGPSRLWPVLRAVALGILVLVLLLGPPGTVVLAKALRRRSRRRDPDVRERIASGWDELVDTAVDQGARGWSGRTRREMATTFGTRTALALAHESDRATYSDSVVTDDEAHAFWDLVEAECRDLRAQASPWRRLRAAVSLASLLRRPRPSDERRARPAGV
ncbi:transglutaminase [Xylanimonas allomyrinae]|uniref:Transglutaminase n=1 Tax=Xylanimonas allomyrinae TaxID=2509459 RepID=A0A4P6EIP6_9MICO|nr:transglutaminase domain-containing protein [Xylanimonas allomyrinae]QAY62165.1 transglutaminase [Xylanimonas allomyrinae]